MKFVWMATAGVCIVIAAAFMLRREFSVAFIVAVVGILAWFLNYRMQMKQIVAAADSERERAREESNEQN